MAIASWRTISVGPSHTAAIRSDNLLFTWGRNNVGQLGDGTTIDKPSPVQIGNLKWSTVSVSGSHTVAIDNDTGRLFAWGLNTAGQLGDSTTINRSSPVQIGSSSWVAISAGNSHTVGLTSNRLLYAWGLNSSGQVGDGTVITKSSPVQIGSSSWVAVSAGIDNSAAIRSDNKLFSWGSNTLGRLGDGTTILKSSPVQIGNLEWNQVSLGQLHSVGITASKKIYTWGNFGANSPSATGDGLFSGATAAAALDPKLIKVDNFVSDYDWSSVSFGISHAAAIRSDGMLFTWGLNSVGQLGDGTTIFKSSPVQIGSSSWTAVSVTQGSHTVAIRSDGIIFAWGLNTTGQLGDGTFINRSSPVQIGSSSWTAVSTGGSHTLGINSSGYLFAWGSNLAGQTHAADQYITPATVQSTYNTAITSSWSAISSGLGSHTAGIDSNGRLYAWGLNNFGQLGDGTTINRSFPVQIGSSSWTAVSVGGNHTLAIRNDGMAFSWGNNSLGQLGNFNNYTMPFYIYDFNDNILSLNTESWTVISAGLSHVVGIKSDGKLFTWGQNSAGQLGDGTTVNKSYPIQIGSDSWTAVSTGDSHTSAIKSDGTLFTWGLNSSGQLGDGTTVNKSSPVQIGSSSWILIDSGRFFMTAINSDHKLFTWGQNNLGQMGDGSSIGKSSPVQIGSSSWIAVSGGGFHTVALRSDNKLFAWGSNDQFQVGDGTTVNKSSPVQIGSSSWTAVTAGGTHSVAISSDNKLFAWGSNGSGQLGSYNDFYPNRFREFSDGTAVFTTANWTLISRGTSHTVGIKSDGKLYSWGKNNVGQLGDGTTIDRTHPIQIGSSSWTAVYCGGDHTVAIRSDGILFTWGLGTSGQLGDETAISKSSPVQIGSSSWTAVSAGSSHTAAIRSDSMLFTWGVNALGALGDGTVINRSSPVQIGSDSWTAVTTGDRSSLAIRSDSMLFTWGLNSTGQLGDGTTINKSSPVQIGSSSWTAVSIGAGGHTVALKSDNVLFTWGSNVSGQLGDGTTVSKSSPVQIGSSSWTAISAGINQTFAIRSDNKLFAWGGNLSYQLGDIQNLNYSSPVVMGYDARGIAGTGSWTLISKGQGETFFIKDSANSTFVFGNNNNFTLSGAGFGNIPTQMFPTEWGLNSWVAVSAGRDHTLGILSGNILYSWGRGNEGQLGYGSTISKSSPTQLGYQFYNYNVGNHTNIFKTVGNISVSRNNSNKLLLWGSPSDLNGRNINQSVPTQIGLSSWTAVSAGINFSLGIKSGGILSTWGDGLSSGQTGDVDLSRPNPIKFASGVTANYTDYTFSNVFAGYGSSWAIRQDGSLYQWGTVGDDGKGLVNSSLPAQVGGNFSWTLVQSRNGYYEADRTNFTTFFAGHTMYIRNNGWLYGTGLNSSGELGDGTLSNRGTVTIISRQRWNDVQTPLQATLALREDGTLWAWGFPRGGVIFGDGSTIGRSSPVQVGSSSWTAISAGETYMLAISSDKKLFSWGSPLNAIGQNDFYEPNRLKVWSGSGWVENSWTLVSSTEASHTAAIRSDGLLFTWGLNSSGQLGDGTVVNKSSPVQIGSSSWTFVTTGSSNTLAIRSDGMLFAWGGNGSGQLGDGTAISKSSPVQIGSSSWTALSVGVDHCLGLVSGGTLFSWGANSQGQLGDGTTINRSSPVQIGSSSWTAVTTGDRASLAIRSGGTLFGWGLNSAGVLGDGTTINKSSPVQIGSSSWTAVSLGFSHTAAIRSDNLLFTWGRDDFGQLGYIFPNSAPAIIANSTSPYTIDSLSWTALSIGNDHAAAIRSDYKLFVWGNNNVGQLGDGTTVNKSSPVQIGSSSWTAVSAGNSHTAAIRDGGTLFVWGLNTSGQIGQSTVINRSSPIQIGTSSWVAVRAGNQKTTAIRSGGTLFNWGLGTSGQLGDGTLNSRSSPVQIGSSSWTALSYGKNGVHDVAIRSGGTLFLWGSNSVGQLGFASTDKSFAVYNVPGQVYNRTNYNYDEVLTDPLSWTVISYGGSHAAGVKSDYSLWAWGGNGSGQLGDGTTLNRLMPVNVGIGTSWTSVSAGSNFTFALDVNKQLWASGNIVSFLSQTTPRPWQPVIQDSDGIIKPLVYRDVTVGRTLHFTDNEGIFYSNPYSGSVVTSYRNNATLSTANIVFITSGHSNLSDSGPEGSYETTWAIDSLGKLYTGGRNDVGQLGDSTTIDRTFPTQVLTDKSWTIISSRRKHSLGIDSNGTLWAWGLNDNGQLGDGTTVNKSSPVQIGSNSWIAVRAGFTHSLGITSNGLLYAWGNNGSGQLGDGTVISKSSPVQIGSDSWTAVTSGTDHSLAIKSGGTLWAWGLGTSGQLGDGTVISKSSPVQIGAKTGWKKIDASLNYNAAIDSDDFLFTWGPDTASSGIIGDNSATTRSSPVQIGGRTRWSNIALSSATLPAGFPPAALATTFDGHLFYWGTLGSSFGNLHVRPQNFGAPRTWVFYPYMQHQNYSGGGANLTVDSIVTGSGSHFGLIANNSTLWMNGVATSGQLGDGTTVNKSLPVQIGSSSWTAVSLGTSHTIAIRSDGALFSWGRNNEGQLGDGTTVNKSSPVQIGSSSWIAVNAGASTSAAISSDSYLFTWGLGTSGQLGDGTVISKSSPVQIGSSSWTAIGGGEDRFIAIRSGGTLFGWGLNTSGQIGDGTALNNSSPVQIGSSSWVAIAKQGGTATGAISNTYRLFTWGLNTSLQLGRDPTGTTTFGLPVQLGSSSWTAVSTGESHTVAIRSGGTLFGWGLNSSGQIGDITTINRSSPVQIGSSSWTAINTGASHTSALRSDNLMFSWGNNGSGQLGDFTNISRSSPVIVSDTHNSSINKSWNIISSDFGSTSGAIDVNYKLHTWGGSGSGVLSRFLPGTIISYPIQLGSSSWTAVSSGNTHTLGIKSDGTLYAWGLNNTGEIGTGTTFSRRSPVQIGTNSWSVISAGFGHSVGITSLGRLLTWGRADEGQLGRTYGSIYPWQIGSSNWTAISAGGTHALAIKEDGSLWAWGDNGSGMLGDLTTIAKNSPIQVSTAAGTSWKLISAGKSTSFAIRSDDKLFAFGYGGMYELGSGTGNNFSSPVQIGTNNWNKISASWNEITGVWWYGPGQALGITRGPTVGLTSDGKAVTMGIGVPQGPFAGSFNDLSNEWLPGRRPGGFQPYDVIIDGTTTSSWTAVAAGGFHSHAIRSGGSVFSWGRGNEGQWGNGQSATNPTARRSSPVLINNSSYTVISAGYSHSVALRSDGLFFGWGANGFGQLGDGTIVNKSVPTALGSVSLVSSSWSAVSAGKNHTAARLPDNSLYIWGLNNFGQLGDNSFITNTTPTKLSSSWTIVSSGNYYNGAIRSDGILQTWGINSVGQLGRFVDPAVPYQIGSSSWTAISAGSSHSVGIKSNGTLLTWGLNASGQLGDGTTVNKLVGVNLTSSPVALANASFVSVSAGFSHTAAIRSGGTLFTWGLGTSGQLGDGTVISKSSPTQIGSSSWTFVAAGNFNTVGIIGNILYTWGRNSSGQLGDGTILNKSSPVQIGSSSWTAVSVRIGDLNAGGIINNKLYTWGDDILRSRRPGSLAPYQINNQSWTFVAAGNSHTVAIRYGGTLFTWGLNNDGQLGVLASGTAFNSNTPSSPEVQIGSSSWTVVSAGGNVSAGLSVAI